MCPLCCFRCPYIWPSLHNCSEYTRGSMIHGTDDCLCSWLTQEVITALFQQILHVTDPLYAPPPLPTHQHGICLTCPLSVCCACISSVCCSLFVLFFMCLWETVLRILNIHPLSNTSHIISFFVQLIFVSDQLFTYRRMCVCSYVAFHVAGTLLL